MSRAPDIDAIVQGLGLSMADYMRHMLKVGIKDGIAGMRYIPGQAVYNEQRKGEVRYTIKEPRLAELAYEMGQDIGLRIAEWNKVALVSRKVRRL